MANPISLTLLTSLLFSAIPVEGLVLPGGVGRLPALGWNSWNAFGCDINASKVLTAARQVVGLGLKDLGYEYINIDDCWSLKDRDPVTQRLVPDSEKFPDGIAGVAKEIHELGLKVGIYSSAGTQTCAGYPASLGYETIDAQTFAEWGIDYLKYDNCGVPSNWTDTYTHCVPDETNGQHFLNGTCPDLESPAPEGYDWRQSNTAKRYRLMRDALMNVNRTIVYSLCVWGQANVGVWGNETGNSWRVSGDITDSYTRIASLLNQHSFYLNAANFWGYPDADMLEVGNGKLTMGENRVHFALWAVMKSPLIIGTELDQISPSHLTILKNKYLLAFNQDPLIGRPAVPFKWGYNPDWTFDAQHPAEYWAGESSSLRGTLVLMLNTENQTALRGFEFREVPGLRHKLHSGVGFKVDLDLGLDGDGRDEKEEGFEVVDIWSGENLGCVKGGISREVESHDVVGVVVLGRC